MHRYLEETDISWILWHVPEWQKGQFLRVAGDGRQRNYLTVPDQLIEICPHTVQSSTQYIEEFSRAWNSSFSDPSYLIICFTRQSEGVSVILPCEDSSNLKAGALRE